MRQRIHIISGLPRSGSTLLAAILRQNPRFQAGSPGCWRWFTSSWASRRFPHDFGAIAYEETELDDALRMPGLHTSRARVSFEPRLSLLPRDLHERFSAQSFWADTEPSRANLVVPRSDSRA